MKKVDSNYYLLFKKKKIFSQMSFPVKYSNKFYLLFLLAFVTLFVFILTCYMSNHAAYNLSHVEFINYTNQFQTKSSNENLERYFRLHEFLSNCSSTRKRIVFNGNEMGILNGKSNMHMHQSSSNFDAFE
jgi:hypothetical protein